MGIGPVNLQHLDGRIVRTNLTDLVSPNSPKIAVGEGLAKDQNKFQKGDLFVNFDIIFPDVVDSWQKLELWVALVEYPQSRPPLHYGVAAISQASLLTAKKNSADFSPYELPADVAAENPKNTDEIPKSQVKRSIAALEEDVDKETEKLYKAVSLVNPSSPAEVASRLTEETEKSS